MLQNTYRLLKFFDETGTIYGRKKLQKMIHLLKSSSVEFPFKYQYHHYGPYSAQLQGTMNELVEQNFIEEVSESGAYTYRITEEGKRFKTMLERKGKFSFHLDASLINTLAKESSQFLEVVSTYAFLLDSGDEPEQARVKTIELKPHLEEHINEAIQFYNEHILQ